MPFTARCREELVGQTVDGTLLAGLLDDIGGRDEHYGTGRCGGAQSCTELPGFAFENHQTSTILCAPTSRA